MCCPFCLFICVCPFGSCKSTCLLSFFYLFGSSRFGYLSVDLPIDLPIVLFISLLTYLRTWFANMYIYIYIYIKKIYIKKTYIYIYTIYILYLCHLVISSLYSHCQTICNSPISVSSIFLLQFLPVCAYFSSLFFVCVWDCLVLVYMLFFQGPRSW